MTSPHARLRASVSIAVVAGSIAAVSGACVFKNASASGQQETCSAIATFFGSCASSTACTSAVNADCSSITGSFSDAVLNDVIGCAQQGILCDAGSVLESPCLFGSGNPPSTIQAQLAADFCTACTPSSGLSHCETAFYAPGGVGVTGAPALAAADGIVGTIEQACIPSLDADAGGTACTAAFLACARPILATQLAVPSACTGDAGFLIPLPSDGG